MHSFKLRMNYGEIGQLSFRKSGSYFSQGTEQICIDSDGIFFGALSKSGLLELRKTFDFFVNLRLVKIFPSLVDKSSLKSDRLSGVDILLVRELVSGIYFGEAGRSEDHKGAMAITRWSTTIGKSNGLPKLREKKASARKGMLTVTHKENA